MNSAEERKKQIEDAAEIASKENLRIHWRGEYPSSVMESEADLEFWIGWKKGAQWADENTLAPLRTPSKDAEEAADIHAEMAGGYLDPYKKQSFLAGWNARDGEVAELWKLLERANEYMVGMKDEFLPMPIEEKWCADYDKLKAGRE